LTKRYKLPPMKKLIPTLTLILSCISLVSCSNAPTDTTTATSTNNTVESQPENSPTSETEKENKNKNRNKNRNSLGLGPHIPETQHDGNINAWVFWKTVSIRVMNNLYANIGVLTVPQ